MQRMGEAHHNAKLTEDQVREIRDRRSKGCPCRGKRPSLQDLSLTYGVSTVMIHNIVHGHSWKQVS